MMLVFTITASLYGFALALSVMTPIDYPTVLQLDGVHRQAPTWCAAMLLFSLLCAFFCGRVSFRWHKAYVLAASGSKD